MLPLPTGRGGAALALCCACAACSTGSVSLVLELPQKPELAPAGAATVTLVAEAPGQTPTATTSQIDDAGNFDLGKLPVENGLSLSVVLRSATQRVVGFGKAMAPVDVSASDAIEVDVPMRRPFAYLTGPSGGVAALDTTLDSSQKTYQQMVAVSGGADLVASAGGDLWAIRDGASAHAVRIAGATHQADGASITLPGNVNDAVATTDGNWLVVGTSAGLAIASTGSGNVTTDAMSGGVDGVAIGEAPGGGLRVIGLSGRRTSGACGSSSKLVIVDLPADPAGDPGAPTVMDAGAPLADVAASETSGAVVGVDPCNGALVRLGVDGDGNSKLANVPAPTQAAMFADQAWALGTVPGQSDSGGVIIVAAHPVLVAAAVDGSGSSRADLPPVRQVAHGFAQNGDDLVLSRDINASAVEPLDLAVVPPGDQVAIVYGADFAAPELTDGIQTVIPMMTAHTSEYELLNATGGALVQRVLDECNLTYDGSQAAVPVWKCEPAPGADWAPQTFTPGGLTVLFGGH